MHRSVALLIICMLAAAGCTTGRGPAVPDPARRAVVPLPFQKYSAVIHDNDDHRDVYTDEYLMALAHNGDIRVDALITTYHPNEYEVFVRGREEIVATARKSGLDNLPVALAGTNRRLERPESNRIEDTVPLDLPASRRIVEVARRATPDAPLVIVTGGQLTAVADAYLLSPDIAERVVVSGVFGATERDYNAGLDSWAWTIVLSRFPVLAIPIGPPGNRGTVYMKPPHVPKARIRSELPLDVPFFEWMYEKHHPSNPLPDEHDNDGQAAIPLVRPDYITRVRRFRPDGITPDGRPKLTPDSDGPVYEALDADQQVATDAFWQAMKSLAADLYPR